MQKKTLVVGLVVAAAALAVAQAGRALVSHGRGGLVNEFGARAEFDYEVGATLRGDRIQKRGRFTFAGPFGDGNLARTQIRMRDLLEMRVDGNVAEFVGNGTMVVRRGRQVEDFRGQFMVRVQDRRNRENPTGDPDTLAIRFRRGDRVVYEYAGQVRPGDLTVATRLVR